MHFLNSAWAVSELQLDWLAMLIHCDLLWIFEGWPFVLKTGETCESKLPEIGAFCALLVYYSCINILRRKVPGQIGGSCSNPRPTETPLSTNTDALAFLHWPYLVIKKGVSTMWPRHHSHAPVKPRGPSFPWNHVHAMCFLFTIGAEFRPSIVVVTRTYQASFPSSAAWNNAALKILQRSW
jgi:hypothetical protein